MLLMLAGATASAGSKRVDERKKPPEVVEHIARFVSVSRLKPGQRGSLQITFLPIRSRRTITAIAPLADTKDPKSGPPKEMLELFKKLKKGDFIRTSTITNRNTTMLKGIARYPLKPGEDKPNCFIFVISEERKYRGKNRLFVILTKFEQTAELPVVNKKGGGPQEPDPVIAETLSNLLDGDVVVVHTKKIKGVRVITSLHKYVPPLACQFVSLIEEKVDGKRLAFIEFKTEDQTRKLRIGPAAKSRSKRPNPKFLAAIKKMKLSEGDWILIATKGKGEDEVITHLARTKKPEPKPKEEDPEKEAPKEDEKDGQEPKKKDNDEDKEKPKPYKDPLD